jgi:glycerol dehydrogenase-like iron-containing ADH family enzyme
MNVWPLPRLSFRGLSTVDETRPAALITQPAAWANVSKSIKQLSMIIQAEPARDDYEFVEYLAKNLPAQVQVVYAVGDGLLVDVAKVVASINDKPLIIIPTSVSSDVPFTWEATVSDSGSVTTEETGPATEVILDMELLGGASAEARGSGIADVLSIVTGLLDWGYAAQKNKTTPDTKLIPWAMSLAAGLASQALKTAPALGKGDAESLRTLIDLLCMTVKLDSQLGHRRASQGIEHVFAELVEADAASHAERIGPGILLASALYNKDTASMRTALEGAGVRLNQLSQDNIKKAAKGLPDYAKQNNLPYSILYDVTADEMDQALNKSMLITA